MPGVPGADDDVQRRVRPRLTPPCRSRLPEVVGARASLRTLTGPCRSLREVGRSGRLRRPDWVDRRVTGTTALDAACSLVTARCPAQWSAPSSAWGWSVRVRDRDRCRGPPESGRRWSPRSEHRTALCTDLAGGSSRDLEAADGSARAIALELGAVGRVGVGLMQRAGLEVLTLFAAEGQ
jgi:hypothetical protein